MASNSSIAAPPWYETIPTKFWVGVWTYFEIFLIWFLTILFILMMVVPTTVLVAASAAHVFNATKDLRQRIWMRMQGRKLQGEIPIAEDMELEGQLECEEPDSGDQGVLPKVGA